MQWLDPENNVYLDELYEAWQEDPTSVDVGWRRYFESGGEEVLLPASAGAGSLHGRGLGAPGGHIDPAPAATGASKQHAVDDLMAAYRELGFLYADLNPLGQYMPPQLKYMYITSLGNYQALDLAQFGLSESDLDTEFEASIYQDRPKKTLREIIKDFREMYTSRFGAEILHIQNRPMRRWLIEQIEHPKYRRVWDAGERIRFQKDLIKAEEFEKFLHSNFIGQKRFSLEGGEALIPALHYLISHAARTQVQEIVVGMAHRGRLNVFTNAMRKPARDTFAMFQDNYFPHEYGGSGDVKYHLGQSFDYIDKHDGTKIHISLVPNPSHLEAVDPVVEGKARGAQRHRGDFNRKKVLPILIHGDSAFSGQGVVAETFNLSQLRGYKTGGTIHIVVNNQIGFTTASRDSRSTFFATDIAKVMPVPIFHVNGDDPEAVCLGIDLALKWRRKFGYDVVVDIFCYRRLGHNEADEPAFTHPIMYSLIKQHPSAAGIYGKTLEEAGVFPASEQDSFRKVYVGVLKDELETASKTKVTTWNDAFSGDYWTGYGSEYSFDFPKTGVKRATLDKIAFALAQVPEGFTLHRKLERLIKERAKVMDSGTGVDWGFAEAMAFGSLLLEGYQVRLSGEDCGRGTFSHRHAVWYDATREGAQHHIPLNHIDEKQGAFSVYDSPLSEFAVLGFEYGYSLAQPQVLVLWEAQFGDFANGAQVIIDQFLSSGESKWFRASGLVLLLPHGYEGQGPEHSNAYLDRYLQLCAEDNMQVCNLTTPAQYYHALRKQMHQTFRKPLVIMTPKSLLRHKKAVSSVDDLENGGFQTVLDDADPSVREAAEAVDTIVLCSGHVYYDLLARREEVGRTTTAILRLEQLYPFPVDTLDGLLATYPGARRFVWAQEEPQNKGGWTFVRPYLDQLTDDEWEYAGRAPSAASSTGSHAMHKGQLATILTLALPDTGSGQEGTK